MPNSRMLPGAALLGAALLGLPCIAAAQAYPAKQIHIICGFPTGTAVDSVARMMGQALTDGLGRQVVVENRTGASGTIAPERVAKSPPDGYTLLLVSAVNTALPALRKNLPYNAEKDFSAIALAAIGSFALVVHPSVPAKSVKELISLARANPGRLSYGSSGIGTVAHLAAELFKAEGKAGITHIPYKGATESTVATVSGEVDLTFATLTAIIPFLGKGHERLRPLAVTSASRSAFMPDLPTVGEAGLPGYDRTGWYGLSAPAGVPADIINQLNGIIVKALGSAEAREALKRQGLEPRPTTPREFAEFMSREIAQNTKLISLAGIKAD